MSYSLIASAAVFAAEAHAGQVRKELNEPYIVHPLRVGKLYAELVADDAENIAACYLHDVPEDTNIPQATINRLFPARTATLVNALTKWWKPGQFDADKEAQMKVIYYEEIIAIDGMNAKFCDRIDNLTDFIKVVQRAPNKHAWAKKYFEKSQIEFVPLRDHVRSRVRDTFDNTLQALGNALG